MSKGNPILKSRLPRSLLAELEALLRESHSTRALGPWDVSQFLRDAIREKIAKRERGRRRYGAKRSPSSDSLPISPDGEIATDEADESVTHRLDDAPQKG